MSAEKPHITIAMCTKNGARFLDSQLQSLLTQTHRNWSLWVSDDGSTDETWAILERFRARHGLQHPVRLLAGPDCGAAANFLSLLTHPEFPSGYTALCDQDDVWLPEKLARGLDLISSRPSDRPSLYGARSFYVSEKLVHHGSSPRLSRPPDFPNALVENVFSGHTAILSPAARDLVRTAGAQLDVPFHDWWLYLLISGAGGDLLFDSARVALYRQHGRNALGANRAVIPRLDRIHRVMRGDYKHWIDQNIEALLSVESLLTTESRFALDILVDRAEQSGRSRLRALRDLGAERQSRLDQAALTVSCLMGYV